MKRSIAKMIAATVGIMFLSIACAGDTQNSESILDSDNPVYIEVWHYYNGPQKQAFDSLVTRFNETVGQEQGIIVEAFGQGNVNELSEKVHDAVDKKVGASEVPTVFTAYTDTVYDLDRRNLIADLEGYFTQEELDEYMDVYIEEGRLGRESGLKIMPTAKSTEIMMVNKTDWNQFAADTGVLLTDLETIEGLVKISESYYRWTDAKTPDVLNDGKAMFGRDAMANYIILGYYQLTGESLFSYQDGKVIFEPDKTAFRKLWDNYYVPYVNGWFGSYGRFRSDDAKTGDLIALVGSTTGAYYFPDQVTRADDTSYPIDAAVFPAPCFYEAQLSTIQQGAGMAVMASDTKSEFAAAVFLKWLVEEERNIDFAVSSGYLPVKKKANDMERIRKSEGFQALKPAVQDALWVSIDEADEYEMYYEPAFPGSSDAREVMEYSLSNRAKADRAQILSLTEGGMPLSQAAAQYVTDQNFESWYQGFIEEVFTAIG